MKLRQVKARSMVQTVRRARRMARFGTFSAAALELVGSMRIHRDADDYYVIPMHPEWVKILGRK